MVKIVSQKDKKLYQCGECGLHMSNPGVIITGELFAMGGTTEGELRETLAELNK